MRFSKCHQLRIDLNNSFVRYLYNSGSQRGFHEKALGVPPFSKLDVIVKCDWLCSITSSIPQGGASRLNPVISEIVYKEHPAGCEGIKIILPYL